MTYSDASGGSIRFSQLPGSLRVMDYRSLPKALLHDHLDGGVRVETILELADAQGYHGLPAADIVGLSDWFDQGRSGSLERYLEAFTHTVAVMNSEEAIQRIAYETGIDLAALASTGDWISNQLQRPNNSRAGAALMNKLENT